MPAQAKGGTLSQLLAVTTLTLKAQTHRGSIRKASTLRRRSRITLKNPSQQRRGSLHLQIINPIQATSNSIQEMKMPCQEEHEVSPARPSLEPLPKRVRTSTAPAGKPFGWKTITEARVDFWNENGTWPTEEQETTMNRFRELVKPALARKRTLSSFRRKHSDISIDDGTLSTQTPSDHKQRQQKSAPYEHPLYEDQPRERGSFMDDHEQGITTQNKQLCQKLLRTPRKPPRTYSFLRRRRVREDLSET